MDFREVYGAGGVGGIAHDLASLPGPELALVLGIERHGWMLASP
jgi:hypothetical protein